MIIFMVKNEQDIQNDNVAVGKITMIHGVWNWIYRYSFKKRFRLECKIKNRFYSFSL